jgi:uncharacterized protein YndB with AHSA1/START domain
MIPPVSHDDTTLVVRRQFAASRERVFRAWVTPEALQRWLRPRGMAMTVRSLDARVGGSFCFELENGTSIVGTYLRFDPLEKLIFTWSGAATREQETQETTVTVDFLDLGDATEVILTHEGLIAPERRLLAGSGWSSMLGTLDVVLSSNHDNF